MTWNKLALADSRQQMKDILADIDPVFREEVCPLCGRVFDWVEQQYSSGHPDFRGYNRCVCEDCDEKYLVQPKDYWRAFDNELLTQSKEAFEAHPSKICHHCGDDGDWVLSLLSNAGVCEACFNECEYTPCRHCRTYLPEHEMTLKVLGDGNYYYCRRCERHVHECVDCGDSFDSRDMSENVNGEWVCESCKENYFTCDICGDLCSTDEQEWIDDNNTGEELSVCLGCCDNSEVQICEHCDNSYFVGERSFTTVAVDDDATEEWCLSCVERCAHWDDYLDDYCWDEYTPSHRDIWGYHDYPQDWVFHKTPNDKGDNPLYMGVELEIDEGGEDWDNAVEITGYMGYPCDESTELKVSHDSSLDQGFEIISMPCTLQYHRENIAWADGMQRASRLGYTSHDAGTCGLHVHVNRSFFNNDKDAERKLALLVTNNQEWLKIFSRRTKWRYCEMQEESPFSVNEFTETEGGTSIPDGLQSITSNYRGHGRALNFEGSRTIEFRFFRGTLKQQTFYASLELVQMLCDCVQRFNYIQLCYVDFKFLFNLAVKRNYKAFIEYSRERGLTMLSRQSVA